jgi:hypothetical protein
VKIFLNVLLKIKSQVPLLVLESPSPDLKRVLPKKEAAPHRLRIGHQRAHCKLGSEKFGSGSDVSQDALTLRVASKRLNILLYDTEDDNDSNTSDLFMYPLDAATRQKKCLRTVEAMNKTAKTRDGYLEMAEINACSRNGS